MPRRFALAIALIAIFASLAGAWTYRQHHRYKHLVAHEPGMVYRSAWLEPDVLRDVIETYQIRSVINLCSPGEMGEQRWIEERSAVENSGARFVGLEMPTTVDPADPAIAKHLELMADPDNYPMLVHCQHGVTRTAKQLAIYDMVFRGLSGEESLYAQPKFGRDDHNLNVRGVVRAVE